MGYIVESWKECLTTPSFRLVTTRQQQSTMQQFQLYQKSLRHPNEYLPSGAMKEEYRQNMSFSGPSTGRRATLSGLLYFYCIISKQYIGPILTAKFFVRDKCAHLASTILFKPAWYTMNSWIYSFMIFLIAIYLSSWRFLMELQCLFYYVNL